MSHYAQEALEGLKAYAHEDGSIQRFYADISTTWFQRPTRRLALSELSTDDFLTGIDRLAEVDRDWVPRGAEQGLYLRSFVFIHSAFLTVKPLTSITYAAIANPSGAYFDGSGVQPVRIWISRGFSWAVPGRTGFAKYGGNYAVSMVAQQGAETAGCSQVIFLDAVKHRCVEELGDINLFVATTDGRVTTPMFTGSILKGVIRSAVLRLATDAGLAVEKRHLPQRELYRDIDDDSVREVSVYGTAAIITPVASLTDPDGTHTVADG